MTERYMLLFMKYITLSLIALIGLCGCRSTPDGGEAAAAAALNIPKWSFLARISTTFDETQKIVPKKVYVFPALRFDTAGQPIDELNHRLSAQGALQWYSPAPAGAELKAIIEKKMRTLGFSVVPFAELIAAESDRSVLVLNIYYTETNPSKDNPEAKPEGSWSTFTRITASTFAKDLSPGSRRDLMNQEMVTIFNDAQKGSGVVKRSAEYLLDYIGINRQWKESINLL